MMWISYVFHLVVQLEIQRNSWYCVTEENPIRKVCLNIYYNVWFDRMVLITILINCITLAIRDPTTSGTSTRNRIAQESEIIFTVLFSIEMLIKMTAVGVFGKNSYFADKWNWLDFIVVFSGYVHRLHAKQLEAFHSNMLGTCRYLALLPNVGAFSSLRILRVLRPLRTVQTAPGKFVALYILAFLGKLNVCDFCGRFADGSQRLAQGASWTVQPALLRNIHVLCFRDHRQSNISRNSSRKMLLRTS